MGFFGAIRSCYVNTLNFSGRARRKEYWYFFLFQVLVTLGIQVAVTAYVASSGQDIVSLLVSLGADEKGASAPAFAAFEQLFAYYLWYCLAYFFLIGLPSLAVTVRRLHDTGHSGWLILAPFAVTILGGFIGFAVAVYAPAAGLPIVFIATGILPLIIYLYIFVLLCIPGNYGNNGYGPDPVPGRRPKDVIHPVYAPRPSLDDQREIEAQRRAEIRELYQRRVLKGQSS